MSQDSVNQAGGGGQPLDVDTFFSVLSCERRRYALYCLQKHQNPMALADLAEEVARLEYVKSTVTEIPAEDVKSVYMMLYHTHVPKMADANVVEYDQDTDSVRLTSEFPQIELEEFIQTPNFD